MPGSDLYRLLCLRVSQTGSVSDGVKEKRQPLNLNPEKVKGNLHLECMVIFIDS